ncbi:MAG TPA: hypothetical protein EYN06_06190 [Myxococcales bacterium]|nr:hypothetical protein [Myxococcales bacterium]HIN86053.1 hypothetical protein [Myxococcales bacterium]
MKYMTPVPDRPLREALELLETIRFSLETVTMALSIGSSPRAATTTLNHRINDNDCEGREAGIVAVEALATARVAFLKIADIFDNRVSESLGYCVGFWSTFEWCWHRLFTDQAQATGQLVLQYEVAEAMRRTRELEGKLNGHVPERFTM